MLSFRRLIESDFDMLDSFYECGIRELENKEFFYNFSDNELCDALGSGYFVGAFEEATLIAAAGIDYDKEYGNNIRQKILQSFAIPLPAAFYEVCGVFVAKAYRGMGLASKLLGMLIEYFDLNNSEQSTLYSIVQIQNDKSLNNFFKRGFYSMATITAPGFPISVCMARLPLMLSATDYLEIMADDIDGQLRCIERGYAACILQDDNSKIYKRVLKSI